MRCGRVFLAAAVYQGGCCQAAATSADHQQLHASADSLELPSGELPGPNAGPLCSFCHGCTLAQTLQRLSRVLLLSKPEFSMSCWQRGWHWLLPRTCPENAAHACRWRSWLRQLSSLWHSSSRWWPRSPVTCLAWQRSCCHAWPRQASQCPGRLPCTETACWPLQRVEPCWRVWPRPGPPPSMLWHVTQDTLLLFKGLQRAPGSDRTSSVEALMLHRTSGHTHILWDSSATPPAGGARGGTGGVLADQPCSCCAAQWQQQRHKGWTGCGSWAAGPARPEWQGPCQALHIAACAAAVQAQAGPPAWRQQHNAVQVSCEAEVKAIL